MSHKGQDLSAEGITAVELNAEDLVDLSQPPAGDRSLRLTDEYSSAQLVDAVSFPTAVVTAQRGPSSSIKRWSGVAVGIFGVAIVASIALGAHYAGAHFKSSNAERVTGLATQDWTPIPQRADVVEVEVAAEEPPPVRFTNPFDKTEVFELPPGTSKQEAREIVAQLLLERARERSAR
jgi:hypothetical protein